MARNRGGSRGGGGGYRPSSPPAPTLAPVPAPQAPVAVTAPSIAVAPDDPDDLRSFEEGGGEVVPGKYLLCATLAVVATVALCLIPWSACGKWLMGAGAEGAPALLGIGVLGLLGLLYWKARGLFWFVLVVTCVAVWAYAPPPPTMHTEPTAKCQSQVRKEIVELTVGSDDFTPAWGWQRGPWGTTLVEFETMGGVEIWYGDEKKSDPHRKIPPGHGEIHDPGWDMVKPNALRLRSLIPGTHKVKVIYTIPN